MPFIFVCRFEKTFWETNDFVNVNNDLDKDKCFDESI